MSKISEALDKYEIEEVRYDFTDVIFDPKGNNEFWDVKDQATAEFILKKIKVKWNERVAMAGSDEIVPEYGDESDIANAQFSKRVDLSNLEYRLKGKWVASWDIDQDVLVVRRK